MDAALKKLEERTLQDNLVLKSCSRNGFLEYRPVKPGTEEMRLVRTSEQAWRKELPNPSDSHRLQRSWVFRRWSSVSEEGVPQKPLLDDDAFLEESKAVAAPEEVSIKSVAPGATPVGPRAEVVDLQGPTECVAGHKYEEIQCFLGEYDWNEAVDKDTCVYA